jgi:hypothetical protein
MTYAERVRAEVIRIKEEVRLHELRRLAADTTSLLQCHESEIRRGLQALIRDDDSKP